MKIDKIIGRMFCERNILIWKLYILLLILVSFTLFYHNLDFMFSLSNEFSTYVWRQRRNYFVSHQSSSLLKVHGEYLLYNAKTDGRDEGGTIIDAKPLPPPLFNWCPNVESFTDFYSSIDNGNNTSNFSWPDCNKIFNNDHPTIKKFKNWQSPCELDDAEMANLTYDCASLHKTFGFDPMLYANEAETTNFTLYPLAFVVLAGEKNAHQLYRLMSQIYRPWHAYCLTYDSDGSNEFRRAISNLDQCLDNVIMPKRFFKIKWASFTILESAMECLKLLNDYDASLPWNYVQFVSWNDFPLRTMEEMIKIAKILNGSQDVELTKGQIERYEKFHNDGGIDHARKGQIKPVPPGNLVVYKGSMAATLSREFVHFLFANKIAQQFFEWCRSTFAAEEHFWATLVHNSHINSPSAFPASCLPYYESWRRTESKPFVSRYQVWYKDCNGKLTSGSCVFGVGDLHKIVKQRELFAHKFYVNFQPAAYYCMSRWYFEKSQTIGLQNNLSYIFDPEFYSNLPGVRYHHLVDKSNFTC